MKRQALLIGGFILGALVLAAVLVTWLGGGDLFQKRALAVVYFQDGVAGLTKGAPVTFRGVPVGQVESIGLQIDAKSLSSRIPVNIRLSSDTVTLRGGDRLDPDGPDIAALVARGLRARLTSQSLVTGQKSVELNMIPGAPSVRVEVGVRPEIPVVAGRLETMLDQLADVPVRETVDDLRKTLADLRAALGEAQRTLLAARATLDTTSREVAGLSSQAQSTLRVTSRAVTDLQASATLAMTSVSRLADTANGTVEIARPELLRTLASAKEAADSARIAMNRVSDMSDPGAPLRADLEGAVADLSQAARGLRDWSELLQEQPNALVFGRRRP